MLTVPPAAAGIGSNPPVGFGMAAAGGGSDPPPPAWVLQGCLWKVFGDAYVSDALWAPS